MTDAELADIEAAAGNTKRGEDVAALIAEVRRLRAERDGLQIRLEQVVHRGNAETGRSVAEIERLECALAIATGRPRPATERPAGHLADGRGVLEIEPGVFAIEVSPGVFKKP